MKPPKKDFAALRRKLARGLLLADAAAEAGMSEQEARDYLDGRGSEDDQSLRAFSDEALKSALHALQRAIREKNRGILDKEWSEGEKGTYVTKEVREEVIDVDAAKALLKAGLDARKILRQAAKSRDGNSSPGQPDLFDLGPWSFKKRD